MTDQRPHLSDRERMRLFRLHNRICHICSAPVSWNERWEIEHVIPRWAIGAAADTDDNMKPAHSKCHKPKTKDEATARAKAIRRETKHLGGHRPKAIMPGSRNSRFKRKMDGTVVDRVTGKVVGPKT